MKICVAGAYGAFGLKHLDALKNIEDLEVVSVMGPNIDKIAALANERHIEHYSDSLEECISLQMLMQLFYQLLPRCTLIKRLSAWMLVNMFL